MYDLIYDASAAESVRRRFPLARIEDASDEIHESRISVDVPVEDDEYLRWVVEEGWGAVSLGIQVMIRDKQGVEKVRGWLDRMPK